MRITNNHIIGLWEQSKQKKDFCLLVAPGLPQYIDKYHPLLKSLESLSIDTFCLRYSGSWENNGKFSNINSINDINNAINFIKEGKGIDLFNNSVKHFSHKKIFLLGFSYGGLPTIFSKYHKDVCKILCCPFVNNIFHKGSTGENISNTIKFIERAYPNLYSISNYNILNELNALDYNKVDLQSKYMLLTGKHDVSIPKKEINWIKNNFIISFYENMDLGHSINIPQNILSKIFTDNFLNKTKK